MNIGRIEGNHLNNKPDAYGGHKKKKTAIIDHVPLSHESKNQPRQLI